MTIPDYIVSVDLGQSQDYTAICVLERHERLSAWVPGLERTYENHFQVIHLDRLPLGTSYVELVGVLQRLWRVLQQRWSDAYWEGHRVSMDMRTAPIELVVDYTGVGRPVADLLQAHGVTPAGVTITGGREAIQTAPDRWSVPKRDLVASVNAAMQTGRLKAAPALPLWPVLEKELLNFKVRISLSGHDSYGAGTAADDWRRDGSHDDLLLATAIGVWLGERLPSAYGVPIEHDPAWREALADMPR